MNLPEYMPKLHSEMMSILESFDSFCKKNDLEYFLAAGTALGARRHSGFIPWDDDLDVAMTMDSYRRFLDLIAKNGRNLISNCHVDVPGDKNYAPMFVKVCLDNTVFETDETANAGYAQGIFLDVLPISYLARDSRIRKKQIRNAVIWQSISYIYHSKTINVPHGGFLGFAEKLGCRVFHYFFNAVFDESSILRHFEKSYIDEDLSQELIFLHSAYMKPIPEKLVFPLGTTIFESGDFPIPGRIDDFLAYVYGDWKKLPSPNQIHIHAPNRIVFSDRTTWGNMS